MTIRYIRHPNLTQADDEWCDAIAEENFHTSEDPDQAGAEDCSFEVSKRFPYAWTVIKDNEKIIGYTYILPARREMMEDFVGRKITENGLVKMINEEVTYSNCDAAYLAGAVIDKEYQNKGYAIRATIDTLVNMDKERGMKIKDLFIWPFTDSMRNMVHKAQRLAERDGRTLHIFEQG